MALARVRGMETKNLKGEEITKSTDEFKDMLLNNIMNMENHDKVFTFLKKYNIVDQEKEEFD